MKLCHGLIASVVGGGALVLAGAFPATAEPDGPILSGTYNAVGQYRAATADAVLHISSKCPGCDAVATGEGTPRSSSGRAPAGPQPAVAAAGPTETLITPSNPTGIVQNYTSVMTFLTPEVCGIAQPGLSNGTRIAD